MMLSSMTTGFMIMASTVVAYTVTSTFNNGVSNATGRSSAESVSTMCNPLSVIPENATVNHYDWNITVDLLNVEGIYREFLLVNGQSPGPRIEGDQGDWVIVNIHNYANVPITIHYHGLFQKKTPWADGVPGLTQYPILSGDHYTYVFELGQYGSYWYHNHYRGYMNDGLFGPIWIRPSDDVPRPYKEVTKDESELELIKKLENSPQQLTLSDFFKDSYDRQAGKINSYGMDPSCLRTILHNGKGRHICLPDEVNRSQAGKKIAKLQHLMQNESAEIFIDSYGCLELGDLNGFQSVPYSKDLLEFPGHNYDCVNATNDREIFYTNNENYVMFNFLNAGGQFAKQLSIDDHNMTVVAIDGHFVKPFTGQQVALPIGHRATVLVKTDESEHRDTSKPFAIRAAINDLPQILEGISYLQYGNSGDSNASEVQSITDPENGIKFQNLAGEFINDTATHYGLTVIDLDTIPPYANSSHVPIGPADVTVNFYLNRLGMTTFSVSDNAAMGGGMELGKPLLFDLADSANLTEILGASIVDKGIKKGDVVDIIIQNTPLADHPIHLHGHDFWLISYSHDVETFNYSSVEAALNDGQREKFNFDDPPYVDTIAVATGGYNVIRFVADNPGIWMVHCHIQTHMPSMAAAIVTAKEDAMPVPINLLSQRHANFNSILDHYPYEKDILV